MSAQQRRFCKLNVFLVKNTTQNSLLKVINRLSFSFS